MESPFSIRKLPRALVLPPPSGRDIGVMPESLNGPCRTYRQLTEIGCLRVSQRERPETARVAQLRWPQSLQQYYLDRSAYCGDLRKASPQSSPLATDTVRLSMETRQSKQKELRTS